MFRDAVKNKTRNSDYCLMFADSLHIIVVLKAKKIKYNNNRNEKNKYSKTTEWNILNTEIE